MFKFNANKILKKDVVVHCKTEEESVELFKWADSMGYVWGDGRVFPQRTRYSEYSKNTCYNIKKGTYCEYSFFYERQYTIYEFEDVVLSSPKYINKG